MFFTYDNKNQLVKVTKPSGDHASGGQVTVEYTYDGNGNRYKKSVITRSPEGDVVISARYYSYDTGGNIVSEYKRVMVNGAEESQILVRYIRDTGGKAISMIQGANTYYFVYNGHGDVTSLTDSTGAVIATYSYDEFGNLQSSTGNIYNTLRYSGANNAYYDTETSLYKMGVRYYQPDIARWLTRDSFKGDQAEPQSKNRYVYVENNPINKTDPTGHWADKVHKSSTKLMANEIGFKYANSAADGAFDMDAPSNSAVNPLKLKYHFDMKKGSGLGNDSRFIFFRAQWQKAINLAKKRRSKEGSYQLGMGLHAIQDRYSHGNIRPSEHGFDYSGISYKGKYHGLPDDPNWVGDPNYTPDPAYETNKGWPGYGFRMRMSNIATKRILAKYKAKVGKYF